MSISNWMSWEAGVDLAALTEAGLSMPNVIVHVARMVHTPVGSGPAGMILFAPEAGKPPMVMGFISTNRKVAEYFGPKIFAGTPFEKAPVLDATIDIAVSEQFVSAQVRVGGHVFETRLGKLGAMEVIHRTPAAMTPFVQQGVEAAAGSASLTVDGKEVKLILPPVGLGGGSAAVWAPSGVYAR